MHIDVRPGGLDVVAPQSCQRLLNTAFSWKSNFTLQNYLGNPPSPALQHFFFTGQLLPTFGPAGDHVAQVGHMVRGERLGNGGAGALPQPDLVEHVLKGLLLLLDGFAGHFVEHRQRQQRFAGFCFAFRCSFGRG